MEQAGAGGRGAATGGTAAGAAGAADAAAGFSAPAAFPPLPLPSPTPPSAHFKALKVRRGAWGRKQGPGGEQSRRPPEQPPPSAALLPPLPPPCRMRHLALLALLLALGLASGQPVQQAPPRPACNAAAPPDAPAALQATPADGALLLSWRAPPNGGCVAAYEVRRGGGLGGNTRWGRAGSGRTSAQPTARVSSLLPSSPAAQVSVVALTPGAAAPPRQRVTATNATVDGLTNGARYRCFVKAVAAAPAFGGAGGEAQVEATPVAACDATALPGAPANLTATAGDGRVQLCWAASADGGCADELRIAVRLVSAA